MLLILGFLEIIMKKKWSIGLMTGTANDGNIDIAALQTDGDKIINFGPFELLSYEDKEIIAPPKELRFGPKNESIIDGLYCDNWKILECVGETK